MSYNPNIHHRRSIRLKGYDYSQTGAYFITICCENRKCRFGNIVENEMILNEYGEIAYNEWVKLSERFVNFELDVFQIMPNHIHGIIVLNNVGAGFTPAQNEGNAQNKIKNDVSNIRAGVNPAPTISDIVGAYKSLVANGCLGIYKSKWAGVNPAPTMGKLWQRNYHEHIIRDVQSYQIISNYIINNPAKWNNDKFYNQ
jgi:putative transposase